MKSLDQKNKFVEMRAKGYSFDKIAAEINVSKKTLIKWSRELALELSNAKEMLKDLYVEKYIELEKKKADYYFETYDKLLEQLSNKNLSKEPVNKILEALKFIEKELSNFKNIQIKEDDPSSFMDFKMDTVKTWKV